MKYKIEILTAFLLIFSGISAAQGSQTDLNMQILEHEPAPLQSGEYADFWVRVTNEGSNDARDVEVEAVDNFPFHTDDRQTNWEIGELKTGQSYLLHAQFRVNENAVFGNNTIKFRKTSGNRDVWITEKFHRQVRTDDRSLVVRDLEFPQRVAPGSTSEMSLELQNSANSNFKNIDVNLDTSDIPVATEETSRKRLSSLGPGETSSVNFTLDIDGDADLELYNLPITIDYQDQAGNEHSMEESTGVNVGGYPNIDVAIEESDIRKAGRGSVTFRIVNKGEGRARFTEMELKESDQYEILSEDSAYIGTMITDDFQTAEFDLYVKEGEELELPVELSYSDGRGDHVEEYDIQRNLYSSSEMRRYGMTGSNTVWILAVFILVAAGAGAYYWRKRRD